MQALMRRNSGLASQVINIPPFQVDLSRRELSVNEEVIKLTGVRIHHYGNAYP